MDITLQGLRRPGMQILEVTSVVFLCKLQRKKAGIHSEKHRSRVIRTTRLWYKKVTGRS